MSYVTTVVIFGDYISDEAGAMLREGYDTGFDYADGSQRRVWFGSLTVGSQDGWVGPKGPEADVFGGAFNYLDTDELKAWLETVPWESKTVVLWESNGGTGVQIWTFGEPK